MEAELVPQTDPNAPSPLRPHDPRWPTWWPTFVGTVLAVGMMVLALFTPIILLFVVVLSAWIIHHSGH
ncbi:MAG TPA: hypothetical protein VFP84_01260 [Kofleriaceae bacterium]|nr:hypothetical protein [Kofleriaceae bacterium]